MTDKNDLEENARIEETQELLENIDDPVKLYLREITSTPLLSNEEEFRLALAVQADELAKNCSNELTGMNLQTILADIQHSWESVINDAHRLKHNPPDVMSVLKEVRAFQDELLPGEPSYTRAFLDLPRWGNDRLWEVFATNILRFFQAVFLLGSSNLDLLIQHLRKHDETILDALGKIDFNADLIETRASQ